MRTGKVDERFLGGLGSLSLPHRTYWAAKDLHGHVWPQLYRTRREVLDDLVRTGIAPTIRHLPRRRALATLRRLGWRPVRVRIVEVR